MVCSRYKGNAGAISINRRSVTVACHGVGNLRKDIGGCIEREDFKSSVRIVPAQVPPRHKDNYGAISVDGCKTVLEEGGAFRGDCDLRERARRCVEQEYFRVAISIAPRQVS